MGEKSPQTKKTKPRKNSPFGCPPFGPLSTGSFKAGHFRIMGEINFFGSMFADRSFYYLMRRSISPQQMAYQPLWVIECQSNPCRRKAVILFTP